MVNAGKYPIHGSYGFKYFSCSSQLRGNDPNWRVESWNHQRSSLCLWAIRMWETSRAEMSTSGPRRICEFRMYFPHPKFGGILCSLPQKATVGAASSALRRSQLHHTSQCARPKVIASSKMLGQVGSSISIPPWSLTWPPKSYLPKRKFIFPTIIFQGLC